MSGTVLSSAMPFSSTLSQMIMLCICGHTRRKEGTNPASVVERHTDIILSEGYDFNHSCSYTYGQFAS